MQMMKLSNKILIAVSAIVGTVVLSAGIMYASDIYTPWQTYSVAHAFPTSVSTVEHEFKSTVADDTFVLNFSDAKDDSVTLKLSDFGTVDVAAQHQSFVNWLLGKPIRVCYVWQLNEDKLTEELQKHYEKNVPAKLFVDDNDDIVLTEDVSYHEFDTSAVIEKIKELLLNDVHDLDLYAEDVALTYPADVVKDDLWDSLVVSEWLNDFSIEYTDGKILDKHFFSQYYADDFDIDLDKLDLSEFLDSLEESYDTAGDTWEFTKHDGKTVNVTNVTFGSHVWRDKETEFIKDSISSRNSVKDRVPEFYGQGIIAGNYIEISLDAQHLWHYKDGKLCCQSDVVTGTKNRRDTPKGVFYISEKIPGKTLRGPGYATYVNRWMRLTNSGVGLHDAGWRGSFGGSIYTYSGSHGCINLPKSFAYALYDEVENKIPVVIY